MQLRKIKRKKLILYSNLILRKSKLFIDLKKKIAQNFFGKIFILKQIIIMEEFIK